MAAGLCGGWAGGAAKVVSKTLSLSEIIDDREVSSLYATLKLERRATWLEMRAIVRQLESVKPGWYQKCRLPAPISLARVIPGSTEMVTSAAGWARTGTDGKAIAVIAEDFDPDSVLPVGALVDRGSTGCAGFGAVVAEETVITPFFGTFHDGWNSARGSAKQVESGSCWKAVIRLAAIGNLPIGPVRTGVWGGLLTEVHVRLVKQMAPDDPRMEWAIQMQARIEPGRDLNHTQRWVAFSTMPICCGQMGTVLKFSRWFSTNQRWAEIRPIYFYFHVVCVEVAMEHGADVCPGADATALWDKNAEAVKKGSRLASTHSYFSLDHVRAMDTYHLATSHLSSSHFQRMQAHLTPEQHLQDVMDRIEGFWLEEAQSMINEALITPDMQFFDFSIPLCDPDHPDVRYADRLHKLAWTVTGKWLERSISLAGGYPELAVEVLADGNAKDATRMGAIHCMYLLEAEKLCNVGMVKELVDDIIWAKWTSNRLLLFLAASDHELCRTDRFEKLAYRVNARLPDERVPEDVHQKVRDTQRCKRSSKISCNSVWDSAIDAGLLEKRLNNVLSVVDQKTAEASFVKRSAPRQPKDWIPKTWPAEWDKILKPGKDWDTLSTGTLASATMSWAVLCNAFENMSEGKLGTTWWTRLARPLQAWKHTPKGSLVFIVTTGNFAAIAVTLQPEGSEAGLWSMKGCFRRNASTVHDCLVTIEDQDQFARVNYTGFRKGNHIVMREMVTETSGMTLLQSALWSRRTFQNKELEWILVKIDKEFDLGQSQAKRLEHIVNLSFSSKEQRAYVMGLYEKPGSEVQEGAGPDLDPETAALIEELAEDEVENAQDLRKFREDVTLGAIRRLAQKAAVARAQQSKNRAARKLKIERNKKLKKGKLLQGMSKKKRKPDNDPSAVPDGEPPAGPGPARKRRRNAPEGGDPPPPEPSDEAAPEQRAGRGKKPGVGGKNEWRCREQGPGWIRWSCIVKKCNAHCDAHKGPAGQECKMDRTVSKGSVALTVAWLMKANELDYTEHQLEKELLSSEAGHDQRYQTRLDLNLQAVSDKEWEEILNMEAGARNGDREEPDAIPCDSIAVAAMR